MVRSHLLMGLALLGLVSIPVQGCLFGEESQDETDGSMMEEHVQVEHAEAFERRYPRTCAAVLCRVGTVCVERHGRARCVPVPEPHPCAAILCMVGTVCRVVDGVAGCYPDGHP